MEEWGFDWGAIKRKIARAKRWARMEVTRARRRIARIAAKVRAGKLRAAMNAAKDAVSKTVNEGKHAAN